MRHDQVIQLISVSITTDEIGNQIENKTSTQIFANEWEVSSSEFYQAATQGLKPEKRFEIYRFEYQEETILMHDDVEYKIIRTQSKGEKLIITCQKVISRDN